MKFFYCIKDIFDNCMKKLREYRITEKNSLLAMEERLRTFNEGINLPEIKGQIILPKNEICHYKCTAWYETKMFTPRNIKGHGGVSIRITKGFSLKIGRSKSREVKKVVKSKERGELFITNKRVIFTGTKKKFTVMYPKLIAIKPYNNGFELQTENISYDIYLKDVKDNRYINAILNGVFSNMII